MRAALSQGCSGWASPTLVGFDLQQCQLISHWLPFCSSKCWLPVCTRFLVQQLDGLYKHRSGSQGHVFIVCCRSGMQFPFRSHGHFGNLLSTLLSCGPFLSTAAVVGPLEFVDGHFLQSKHKSSAQLHLGSHRGTMAGSRSPAQRCSSACWPVEVPSMFAATPKAKAPIVVMQAPLAGTVASLQPWRMMARPRMPARRCPRARWQTWRAAVAASHPCPPGGGGPWSLMESCPHSEVGSGMCFELSGTSQLSVEE